MPDPLVPLVLGLVLVRAFSLRVSVSFLLKAKEQLEKLVGLRKLRVFALQLELDHCANLLDLLVVVGDSNILVTPLAVLLPELLDTLVEVGAASLAGDRLLEKLVEVVIELFQTPLLSLLLQPALLFPLLGEATLLAHLVL